MKEAEILRRQTASHSERRDAMDSDFLYYAFALVALVVGLFYPEEGCYLYGQDGGGSYSRSCSCSHLLALFILSYLVLIFSQVSVHFIKKIVR